MAVVEEAEKEMVILYIDTHTLYVYILMYIFYMYI